MLIVQAPSRKEAVASTNVSSGLFSAFFLRGHKGTVQAFATIVAVDTLDFVFVPALRANQFRHCCCSRHTADSFFGLVGGPDVDVFAGGIFDSLPALDFSPAAVGASFLAASW